MSRSSGSRVYVGNLPPDVRESEIERIFDRYGRIRDINIKAPRDMGRGPNTSFAFVEFEDPRDAEDAVHEEDGQNFDRMRLRVEIAGNFRCHYFLFEKKKEGGKSELDLLQLVIVI
jgi:arginine/serine-rich splicing factor 1/9